MANYRTSRILPIALVIIITIIAVAALISVARVVFFSGTASTPELVDTSRESLLNTAAGHSVSMTIRGPIVADEEFHSVKIDISASTRQIETYKGYLDAVVDKTTLSNNVAAYEQFVYALDKANMMKGQEPETEAENDLRGICASGYVYEYTVLSSGNDVKTLWTSTCGGSKGTLEASREQLTSLFLDQIPNSNDYIPFKQSFNYSL